MADNDCACQTVPCFCRDVERDVDHLLANPKCRNPNTLRYPVHGYPWPLINALRRRVLATAAAERKRCTDYVRVKATRVVHMHCYAALADELERLPES